MSKAIRSLRLFKRFYSSPGKTHALGGDSRNDVIRRALFDAPLRKVPQPTEEDLERDRVIESAWEVYMAQKKDQHQNQLNIKYQRMVEASKILKQLSPKLFEASQVQTPALLFPKQMKIPSETPASQPWNYESVTKTERLKAEAQAKKDNKNPQ